MSSVMWCTLRYLSGMSVQVRSSTLPGDVCGVGVRAELGMLVVGSPWKVAVDFLKSAFAPVILTWS